MRSRSFAVAAAVSLVLVPAAARAVMPPLGIGVVRLEAEYVPGELLVKFKDAIAVDQRHAAIAALGHDRLATIDPGWIHVRTAPGETVEMALAAYALDPTVEWAQPNYVYRAMAVPNDPLFPQIWGLQNTGQTINTGATQPPGSPLSSFATHNPGTPGDDMNLVKAWDHITDCSSVVVAVVDTGVNYNHLDLATNMWNGGVANPNHGKNFVNAPAGGDDLTLDKNGHGTHVAGTIGAIGNNARGTVGVCWKTQIMAVRVLDASGSGNTADIGAGINFAVSHGAKVINMSLGGSGFDQTFSDTITNAQSNDVLVVVAAGNSNLNNDVVGQETYPCNFSQPNLLCVAALDQGYARASFSNWGAISVDVGAPGTNVVSTWPGDAVGDRLDGGHAWNNLGAWGFATLNVTSGGVPTTLPALANPASFTGTYANNADARTWSSPYNLSGATSVTLQFAFVTDMAPGDSVSFAAAPTAGDPFLSSAGFPLAGQTFPQFSQDGADIGACGATCTIGFRLTSNSVSQTNRGAAIVDLTLQRIDAAPNSYNTENGTSMATPMTAGVATMIRAFNPQYTSADTVAAIKGGGRPIAALAGITTTGKAVDAMGSIAFIQAPTGLAVAAIQ